MDRVIPVVKAVRCKDDYHSSIKAFCVSGVIMAILLIIKSMGLRETGNSNSHVQASNSVLPKTRMS